MLHGISNETVTQRRQSIIDLCAAAYPDIRPWQVESACSSCHEGRSNNLYYLYLSHLLHPIDGHDLARRDDQLVKVRMIFHRMPNCLICATYLSNIFVRNGANSQ
jgi:hypothetical protein